MLCVGALPTQVSTEFDYGVAARNLGSVVEVLAQYSRVYAPCEPHYLYCKAIVEQITSTDNAVRSVALKACLAKVAKEMEAQKAVHKIVKFLALSALGEKEDAVKCFKKPPAGLVKLAT